MSSAAVEQVVTSEVDIIETVATYVNALTEQAVFSAITNAIDGEGLSDFKLGALLARVQDDKLWKGSFNSLQEFIEAQGIAYHKGMYLIRTFNTLVGIDVPWSKVQHLGWTKLKELSLIITQDNADQWIEVATHCSVLQLAEAIRQARSAGDDEAPTDMPDVVAMVFKVHPEQKHNIDLAIAKAKKAMGTEYITVALDAICLNYLSGEVVKAVEYSDEMSADLTTLLRSLGVVEVAEAVDVAFPDVNFVFEIPT